MRVLILGARSPACLEWLRALRQAGHRVWLADSLAWPLARFSRASLGYHRLPPPRQEPKRWAHALRALVLQLDIEICLPTCEEVFYLAWLAPHLPPSCHAFCPDLACLDLLHNKARFAQASQAWPIRTPASQVIRHAEALSALGDLSQWVLKPLYSRFASRTLIGPSSKQISALDWSEPWLAQRRVTGQEFCSQSLFVDGQLQAHALYQPCYRAGQGAGVYFAPAESGPVLAQVQQLGLQLGLTGQLGLDWLQDEQQQWWLLEANPRATSGLHLLTNLAAALAGNALPDQVIGQHRQAQMVALATCLFGRKHWHRPAFWRDFYQARDVIWRASDPLPSLMQGLSAAELLLAALRSRQDVLTQTTHDLAWNGETLPPLPLAAWSN